MKVGFAYPKDDKWADVWLELPSVPRMAEKVEFSYSWGTASYTVGSVTWSQVFDDNMDPVPGEWSVTVRLLEG